MARKMYTREDSQKSQYDESLSDFEMVDVFMPDPDEDDDIYSGKNWQLVGYAERLYANVFGMPIAMYEGKSDKS